MTEANRNNIAAKYIPFRDEHEATINSWYHKQKHGTFNCGGPHGGDANSPDFGWAGDKEAIKQGKWLDDITEELTGTLGTCLVEEGRQTMPSDDLKEIYEWDLKIDEEAFQLFCKDVKENGIHIPIKVKNGYVVDGRLRLRACQVLGMDVP